MSAAVVKVPAGPWHPLESAPKDRDQYIRVLTFEVFRWLPYKPNSSEFKRGQKGRWQKHNGYGFDTAELAGIGYQLLDNDGIPVGAHEQAVPQAQAALATLLDVCERMDLENEQQRPTEEEYQQALASARVALGKVTGSTP